ncbi:unnamed protein product [Arabidopsis arenosa]|uniref:Uncharacterized protein n=1 Tax=Arabidopsis arenosa TaxID=38785 RepID=A0A8S2A618_ARAAE|nr:unnamed protein product [Arabidopsis arenosa]
MDKSIPILEATPVSSFRPDKRASDDTNDESHKTSTASPPRMVSPLRTISPFDDFENDWYDDWYDEDAGLNTGSIKGEPSDDVNGETDDSSAAPPLMVTPLQTIRPSDDSNNNCYDVGAGPSTVPVKRGRGRPKGSKKPKKPKTDDPNSRMVESCSDFESRITEVERETGNQEIVGSVLKRFDAVRRRLCQLNHPKHLLTTASTNCTKLGVQTNRRRRIGAVPGVQVGDIFYYWGEMCLVGLHKPTVAGIDYLTAAESAVNGQAATSVVTAGKYDDETEELDTLIYSGHGRKVKHGPPCDQVLQRGNLALEASERRGNDVRVVRREVHNNEKVYIYDGLYMVSRSWIVTGKSGSQEFRFKLVRKPDQPPGYAIWKLVEKLRNHDSIDPREGFILQDLSFGEELLPVHLVNEVDEDDKTIPEDFEYIRSQCYSGMKDDLNVDIQSLGCHNCEGESCSHQNCTCMGKNGGQLPYHKNILVCRKPLIYECGESCTCPIDCPNRLVQTGLKLHLEVFKTTNCGWGLRSWDPIRAGTFICEFAGVSKTKEEVEEDDDYLFDTSRIYHSFIWNYEPQLLREDASAQVSEVINLPTQVLISAKEKGNVGRFMNHSCSPNVFWQPIEYENNGYTYVRIGLFAMKHIPPMTELTYDYGVSSVEKTGEDEVIYRGKKICLCGSVQCRGSFG